MSTMPVKTLSVLISAKPDGTTSAHALDIDVVCVAPSQKEAVEKLRLASKSYIEHGMANGWERDIIFPAPEEYWEALSQAEYEGSFTVNIEPTDGHVLFHAMLNEAQRTASAT